MSCNPFGAQYNPEWADKRTNIVISDSPDTKYVGDNRTNKEFNLFKIDGNIISDQTKVKCDYLLVRCPDKQCFFVELKGRDLVHAANQIIGTIKELKATLGGRVLNARIVLTKTPTPSLSHSSLIRLEEIVRATGGNFIRSNVQLRESH